MHQWNQEPTLRGSATAWNRENQRDLQEDHRAGGLEASSRDFQRVAENQELDLVGGSAPSEAEEPTSSISARRVVGSPATRVSFSPLLEKREREKRGNPLDDGDNLD
jgi:hypothetical protein